MTTSETGDITVATTLDTSGLLCPLPVYKAALVLKPLRTGDVLELICTDPGSLADIPAMVRQRGDELLETTQTDTTQVFLIRKGQST
jgi:tRNA 2-thiouridine synthesizing protein A